MAEFKIEEEDEASKALVQGNVATSLSAEDVEE